jgi:hypothetical protein
MADAFREISVYTEDNGVGELNYVIRGNYFDNVILGSEGVCDPRLCLTNSLTLAKTAVTDRL